MVQNGDAAPDFEAPTQKGEPLKLSSLRGHPVVLYFYPQADTPGCTRESKGFRDLYPQFRARGVEIVGVSTDSVGEQAAFCEKYSLPFPLVADQSKEVGKKYGVLRPSGRARRVSFLIGPDGKVLDSVDDGAPEPHVERAKARFLAPS
jgi:peroxiredoxin Q/BCP